MPCVIVVVLLVFALGAFFGYCVGYSLGHVDGKYQERKDITKWASENGHNEMMLHIVHECLKDAVGK